MWSARMNRWTRIVFLGGIAIISFDALASVASQQLGFAYSTASIGSGILYIGIGFIATRATGLISRAALAAAIVGVVEATLGWWVSWIIGPGRSPAGPPSVLQLLTVIASLAGVGAIVGAFGGWASTWGNSARSAAS